MWHTVKKKEYKNENKLIYQDCEHTLQKMLAININGTFRSHQTGTLTTGILLIMAKVQLTSLPLYATATNTMSGSESSQCRGVPSG